MTPEVVKLAERLRESTPPLDPKDPFAIAKTYLDHRSSAQGNESRLVYWRGSYWEYRGTAYHELGREGPRADLWPWLAMARRNTSEGTSGPFKPNKTILDNVCDALKAACRLDDSISPPARIDAPDNAMEVDKLLPVANGLLDLRTGHLLAPSPDLFVTSVSPVAFDPDAGKPVEFLKFLESIWPDDPGAIDTLQEWFGYCLTADTRQQKILLIVGPPRSGKGTLGRVLTRLLGQGNVESPSLASFAQNFGLQSLIGKNLAIVSDARLSGRADQSVIVERLLTISGEDSLTIDRKYMSPWTGKLPTRLVLMTNELPRLSDASNALTRRFIVLQMHRSFLDHEDHGLFERLADELPEILGWSLVGLFRLRERGRFTQPESGRAAIDSLLDLASPVSAFVDEWCEQGEAYAVAKDRIYQSYQTWAQNHGHRPPSIGTFGRDLFAVCPGLQNKRARKTDGGREYQYIGIRLRPGAPGVFGPAPVYPGSG